MNKYPNSSATDRRQQGKLALEGSISLNSRFPSVTSINWEIVIKVRTSTVFANI